MLLPLPVHDAAYGGQLTLWVAATHRVDDSLACENDRVPVPVQIQFESALRNFSTRALCAAAALVSQTMAMHDGMGAKRSMIRLAWQFTGAKPSR
jgi:hypothetical protein